MTTKFVQPDYTSQSQSGTTYPLAIDAAIAALAEVAANFAPSAQDSPDMTVLVRAGKLWAGSMLVAAADQSTPAIAAPAGNPRIDRVVVSTLDGTVSVVTGTEAAAPSAPAIPVNAFPVCQVSLAVGAASISDAMITDERPLLQVPDLTATYHWSGNIGGSGNVTYAKGSTHDIAFTSVMIPAGKKLILSRVAYMFEEAVGPITWRFGIADYDFVNFWETAPGGPLYTVEEPNAVLWDNSGGSVAAIRWLRAVVDPRASSIDLVLPPGASFSALLTFQ